MRSAPAGVTNRCSPGGRMTTARDLRVSDLERQAAAQRLGAAWAEGRLDDAEYDRRLTLAYAAVTYRDLDSLFPDLPGQRPLLPPPVRWARPTGALGEA